MDNQQDPAQNNQRFVSDTQRIVHRHLADPNHVITDEEIASIRIGMAPQPDVPTQQAIQNADDRIADRKADEEGNTIPGAQKSTPWDVMDS